MSELTENRLTSVSNYKVTSADTDMYARLRLSAMVNYLIQSAIDSADKLGFGYGGIRQQNLFWVLSRLTVEVYRPLEWYETVEVETWPKNIERILYLRDFILRDKKRNVIAKATSGWLAVDIETKRIKKIEGVHAEFFAHLKDKHAISEPPAKLFPVDGDDTFEISSGYFDIDLNGHVTTTRYVDWMMDTLPLGFHKEYYPEKLSLNIMKETMPEETIRIMRNRIADNRYTFEGFNMNNNTNAFRACIEF
ncbi:MAG: acyl-[acyl-carrier-protein] thioesterase [Bacteroidales bacterium]